MSVYKVFIRLVFNRECMERNVMTSFRILSSFEFFLRYFQTEWSVFLPFSVNCLQVAMFWIMPAFCPHGQGEWGWSTKCGQAWTGGGGSQKFTNLGRHPLWMTPSGFHVTFLSEALSFLSPSWKMILILNIFLPLSQLQVQFLTSI